MVFSFQGTLVRTQPRSLRKDEKIRVTLGYRPTNAILIWNDESSEFRLQLKNDQVRKIKWEMKDPRPAEATL